MVAAAVQGAERILRKVDDVSGAGSGNAGSGPGRRSCRAR